MTSWPGGTHFDLRTGMPVETVRYPAPGCLRDGCQLRHAADLLDSAREMTERSMELYEDVALWCGVGGHAFSPLDPGRQRVTVQQWDGEARETKPVNVAACGEHARPVAIATRPKQAINGPAAPDGRLTVDAREYAAYQAYLEAESRKLITDPPAGYQGAAE